MLSLSYRFKDIETRDARELVGRMYHMKISSNNILSFVHEHTPGINKVICCLDLQTLLPITPYLYANEFRGWNDTKEDVSFAMDIFRGVDTDTQRTALLSKSITIDRVKLTVRITGLIIEKISRPLCC